MGDVSKSIDNILASSQVNGALPIHHWGRIGATTTAANTTSGYVTAQRLNNPIAMMSSFGSGVSGAVLTRCDMVNITSSTALLCAIEYELGRIDLATGTFTAGSTMPTKSVAGVGIQTAAEMMFLVSTTTATATTPVITITYTDQDGNTGQTASMTLPTNSLINSAYSISPHLATGDTGIRAVTNMTKSAGTVGILRVYGLLVLQTTIQGVGGMPSRLPQLTLPLIPWTVAASEIISFYRIGSTAVCDIASVLSFVGDN